MAASDLVVDGLHQRTLVSSIQYDDNGNITDWGPANSTTLIDVFEPEVDDKKRVKVQFDSQRKNITDLNQRKK